MLASGGSFRIFYCPGIATRFDDFDEHYLWYQYSGTIHVSGYAQTLPGTGTQDGGGYVGSNPSDPVYNKRKY